MMRKIVVEAERERHAGGMPPRAKQEQVAAEPNSFTGQYLKPLLARSSRAPAKAGAQPDLIPAK